jgi:hypothetical protein
MNDMGLVYADNETIQSQLELPLIEKRKVQVADGRVVENDVVVVNPQHPNYAVLKMK